MTKTFTTQDAAGTTVNIEIKQEFDHWAVYADNKLFGTANNWMEVVEHLEEIEKKT